MCLKLKVMTLNINFQVLVQMVLTLSLLLVVTSVNFLILSLVLLPVPVGTTFVNDYSRLIPMAIVKPNFKVTNTVEDLTQGVTQEATGPGD